MEIYEYKLGQSGDRILSSHLTINNMVTVRTDYPIVYTGVGVFIILHNMVTVRICYPIAYTGDRCVHDIIQLLTSMR